MVLTRATLEKLGKEELISMFLENYEKLNDNVTQLTNQLAQIDKILKRMELQLAVSKSVNEAFQKNDENVLKLLEFQALLMKLR